MNKKSILPGILAVVFLSSNLMPYGVHAAPLDMVAQDELFFAQQELKQAKDKLLAKEAELSKLVMEKEVAKMNAETASREKELLQAKIDGLQKNIVERDQSLPKQIEQSIGPLQSRADELSQELKVLQFSLEQKNIRLAEVEAQKQGIELQMRKTDDEKLLLRDSLRRVGDELDKLKTNLAKRVQEETAVQQAKIVELESKASAQKTLTDEKIKQASVVLEDKVRSLDLQLKSKDDEANAKVAAIKEQLDQKIKNLEAALLSAKNETAGALKNAEGLSKATIETLRQELGAREADAQRRVAEAKVPYEEKIKQLTSNIATVKEAALKDVQVIKGKYEEKVTALQAEMGKAKTDADVKVKAVREELQKKIDELNNKIEQDKTDAAGKLGAQRLDYDGKLALVKQETLKVQQELSSREGMIASLKQERDALLLKGEDAKKSEAVLTAKISGLQDEMAALKKNAELQVQVAKNDSALIVEKMKTDAQLAQEKIKAEADKALANADGRVAKIQEELNALRIVLKDKETQAQVAEKERDALSAKLATALSSGDALRKNMEMVQAELKTFQQSLPQKLEEGKAPLAAEIGMLKAKITALDVAARDADAKARLDIEKAEARTAVEVARIKEESAKALAVVKDDASKALALAKNDTVVGVKAAKEEAAAAVVLVRNESAGEIARIKAEASQMKDASGEEIRLLKAKIAEVQSSLPRLVELEKTPLQEKIRVLETELQQALIVAEKTSGEIKSGYETKLTGLKNTLDQQKVTFEEQLRAVKTPLEAEVRSLQQKLAEMDGTLKVKEEKIAALSSDREALLKEKEKTALSFAGEKNALMSAKADLEGLIKAAQDEGKQSALRLKELSDRKAFLDEALAKASAERVRLTTSLETVQQELKVARESVPLEVAKAADPLKGKIADIEAKAKEEAARMQMSISDLAAKMKAMTTERDALLKEKEKLVVLRANIEEELKTLKETATKEVEALPLKLAEARKPLEEKIGALSLKTVSLEAALKDKDAALLVLSKEREALTWQRATLQSEKEKLSLEAERNVQTLKMKLDDLQEEGVAKAQAAKVQLASVQEDGLRKVKASEEALSLQQKNADEQMRKVQASLDASNAQLKKVQASLEASNIALKEKQDSLTVLTGERNVLSAEKVKAVELKASTEEALKNVKAELAKENASLPEKLAQVKRPLEAELAKVKAEWMSLNEGLKNKEAQFNVLSKEHADLLNEKEKLVVSKGELEAALKDVKGSLMAAVAEMPGKIAEAKKPLESKAAGLEQELRKVSAQLTSANDKIQTLLSQQTKVMQENAALLEARNTAVARVAQLTIDQKDQAEALPVKLAETKRPLEEKIQDLEETVATSQKTIAEKENAISALDKEKAQLMKDKDSLGAAVRGANEKIALLQADIARARQDIDSKKAENAALLKERDGLENEKAATLKETAAFKKEFLALQGRAEKIAQAFEEKEKALGATIKERDGLLKDKVSLEALRSSLEGQLKESREKFASEADALPEKLLKAQEPIALQVKEAEAKYTTASEALKNKSDEAKSLQIRLEEMTKKAASLDNERAKLTQALSALQQEKETLNASIPGRVASVEVPLKEKVEALQKQLSDMNSAYKSSETEKGRILTQLGAVMKERDTLNVAVADLSGQLTQFKGQLVETREALKTNETLLPEKLASAQAEALRPVTDELAGVKAKLTDVSAQLVVKAKTVEDLSAEREALKKQIEGVNARYGKLEMLLKTRMDEMQKVIGEKDAALTKLKEDSQARWESREVEVAGVAKAKDALLKEKEQALSVLGKEAQALKTQLDQVIKEKENAVVDIQQLSSDKAALEKSIPLKVSEALRPLEAKTAQIVAELDKNAALLASKEKELSALNGAQAALQKEFKGAQEEIAGLSLSLTRAGETASVTGARLQDAKKELNDLTKEKDALVKNIGQLLDEKKGLEEALMASRREAESLQASIPERLSQVQTPLNVKLSALEKTTLEKDQVIKGLEADLSAVGQELALVKKEYATLTAEKMKADAGNQTLAKELQALKGSIPQQLASVEKPLTVKIADAEERARGMQEMLSRKEALIKDAGARQAALLKEMNEVKQAKSDLEVLLAKERTDHEAFVAGVPQQLLSVETPLKNEVMLLQKKLADNASLIHQKEEVYARLTTERDGLLKDKNAAVEEVKRLSLLVDRSREEQSAISTALVNAQKALNDEKTALPLRLSQLKAQTEAPLNARLAELDSTEKALNAALSEKQKNIVQLLSEKDRLSAQLKEEQGRAAQLSGALDVSRAEASRLKEALPKEIEEARSKARDEATRPLQAEVARLNTSLVDQKKTLDLTNEQLRIKAENEKTALQARISDAEKSIQTKDEALKALAVSKDKLDVQLKEALAQRQRQEEAALKAQALFTERLKAAETALVEVQKKAELQLGQAQESGRAELTNVKAAAQNAQASLSGKVTELSEKIKEQNSVIKEREDRLTALDRQRTGLQQELKTSQDRVISLEADLKSVGEKLSSAEKSIPQRLSALRVEVAQPLEAEMAALKAKTAGDLTALQVKAGEDVKRAQAQTAEVKASLEKALADAGARVSALDQQVSDRQAQVVLLTKEKEEVTRSLAGERAGYAKLTKEHQDLIEKMKIVEASVPQKIEQSVMASVAAAREPLQNKIAELEKRTSAMSDAIGQKDVELSRRAEALAKLVKERDLTSNELNSVKAEKGKILADLMRTEADLKATASALPEKLAAVRMDATKPLEAELAKTKQKADEDVKAAMADALSKVNDEKARREAEQRTLQEKMGVLNKELLNAQNAMLGVKTSLEGISQQRNSLVNEVAALKKENTVLARTLDEVRSEGLKEKEAGGVRIANLEAQMKAKTDDLMKQVEERIRQAENKVVEMRQQAEDRLAMAKAENQRAVETVSAEAVKTRQEAEGKLAQFNKEAGQKEKALQDELSALRQSLDVRVKALSDELKTGENSFLAMKQERDALSLRLKEEQAASLKLNVSLNDAKNELARVQQAIPAQVATAVAAVRAPLQTENSTLKDALTKAKEELAVKLEELKDLNAEFDGVKEALVASEKERVIREKQGVMLTAKLSSLSTSIPDQVASAREPVLKELNTLKEKIVEQTADMTEKQRLIDVLSADKAMLLKQAEDLRLKQSGMGQELLSTRTALKAQEEDVVVKMALAKKPLEEALIQAKKDQDKLRAEIGLTADQLRAKMAALDQLNTSLVGLTKERDLLITEKMQLNAQLEQIKLKAAVDEKSAIERLAQAETNVRQPLEAQVVKVRNEMSAEIKALEEKSGKEAEALQAKISSLDMAAKDLSGRLAEKEAVLKSLSEEKQNLSMGLASQEKAKASLEGNIAALKKEMEAVNASVAERVVKAKEPLEKHIKDLENQLRASEILAGSKLNQMQVPLKDRISFLENEVKTAQDLYQQQEKMVKEMVAKRDELLKNLGEVERDRQSLKVQVTGLTNKLTESESALPVRLAQAKAPSEAKTVELESQVEKLTAALKEALENKDKMAAESLKEAQALRQSLDQAVREKTSVGNELSVLKATAEGLSVSSEERARSVEELRQKNFELTRELSALQGNKASLDKKFQQTDAELKNFQGSISKRIEEARQPLEDTLRSLEKNLFEKDTALKDKDAEIMRLTKERNNFVGKFSQAEEQGKTSLSKMAQLESQQAAFDQKMNETIAQTRGPLEKQITDLTLRLSSLQAERKAETDGVSVKLAATNAGWEKQMAALKAEMERMTAASRSSSEALKVSYEEKIAQLNMRLNELKADLDGRVKTASDARSAQDAQRAALNALKEEKAKMSAEILQLREALKVKEADMTLKVSSLSASRQDEIKAVEEKWGASKAEIEKTAQALKAQLNAQSLEFTRQMQAKEMILKEKELAVSQMQFRIEGLEKDLDMMKQDKTSLDEEKARMEQTLKESKAGSIESRRVEIDAAKAPLLEQSRQLQKTVELKEEEIKAQKARESVLIQTREKMNGEFVLLKDQLGKLEAQYAEAMALLSNVQGAGRTNLDEARKELEGKIVQIQAESAPLKAQIMERDASIKALKASLEASVKEKDVMNAEALRLKEKTAALETELRSKDKAFTALRQQVDTKQQDLKAVQDELNGAMELVK